MAFIQSVRYLRGPNAESLSVRTSDGDDFNILLDSVPGRYFVLRFLPGWDFSSESHQNQTLLQVLYLVFHED